MDIGVEIKANIGPKSTDIYLTENNKQLPVKQVATKNFIKTLNDIMPGKDGNETPLLPSDYGTRKHLQVGENNHYLLITTPPGIQNIEYSSWNVDYFDVYDEEDYGDWVGVGQNRDAYETLEEYVDSYLSNDGIIRFYKPSMVWFLHLRYSPENNMYTLVKNRSYAKESVLMSMNDTLRENPTGNIYPNRNVCWGEADVPPLTIQGAMAVDRLFFHNQFNTDLETIYPSSVEIGGYTFSGKTLNLLENQEVLQDLGEDAAAKHMSEHLISLETNHQTVGDVWNEFTK